MVPWQVLLAAAVAYDSSICRLAYFLIAIGWLSILVSVLIDSTYTNL